MDYKIKIDPKREYVRHSDGDIVPDAKDLHMTEEDYFQLTLDGERFPLVLRMFNDEYQRHLTVGTVSKSEKRRAKLADHWYKRTDKTVLRDIVVRNMPNAIKAADSLAQKENSPHFRSYYYDAVFRIKESNLVMPSSLPDSKLAWFPHFDGHKIRGTDLQIFRMYMALFPSVKRVRKFRDLE